MTKMEPVQFDMFRVHAHNIVTLLLENEMNKHTIEGIRLSWDADSSKESLEEREKNDRKLQFLSAVLGYVSQWIMEGKQKDE